jgi:hypothetical protein
VILVIGTSDVIISYGASWQVGVSVGTIRPTHPLNPLQLVKRCPHCGEEIRLS